VSFRALHKAVTYLISGLGLYALSLGGELDAVGLSLMTIGYAASWFAEGAPWHTSTTIHRGWTGAIVALFVLQLVRGFLFAVPAIPLGLEFLAFLIVSRLANRRSAAEYQQLGALNLLALIAGTLLSTELSYAFLFVGFLIVLPWVLALSHLRAEIDVHFGGLQRAGEKGPKKVQSQEDRRRLGRVLASKRVVTPAFLFRTARLTLPLFVFTAAVFVAFPRIGLGFLSFGLGVGQRASGFGANVELGDFGTIRTDPTVVLRVTPPDLSDTPPREVDFRLRGTSFDAYDGRRWTRRLPSDAPQRQRRRNDRYPIPVRYPIVGQDRPWRIILDHLEEPVMFLPGGTVGLSIPERLQSGFPVGRRIRLSPGMDVRYDADGNGLRYTAWVGAAPPEDSLTDVERRAYLAVPAGHERVAALAREWTEGADSDRERVARLLARLQSSSDFTYSLEMPAVGADALPLEVFLFEARRGHCEYFSTALAIQARTLGIPSRNVTGFLGGQWNAYGEYYSLRQGDAHSWVEVWIEGAGWVVVDPTPSGRGLLRPGSGLFGVLGEMFDAVATRWEEDIVNFDLRSQRSLAISFARGLRRLGRFFGGGGEDSDAVARGGRRVGGVAGPSWVGPAIAAILVLALFAFLAYRWTRRRRARRARERAMTPSAAEAVRLYRDLERILDRKGAPRPPAATAAEHLETLRAADFVGIEVVEEITRRYEAARFAGEGLTPVEVQALRRRLRQL
jgi:transglutaminase-like putative cysteine protease